MTHVCETENFHCVLSTFFHLISAAVVNIIEWKFWSALEIYNIMWKYSGKEITAKENVEFFFCISERKAAKTKPR